DKPRVSSRQLFLESLEDRRLLAVGPQLIGIQPSAGDLLALDGDRSIRTVAPSELLFRFDENQVFNQASVEGIQITRSLDGEFNPASATTNFGLVDGAGNDIVTVSFTAVRLGEAQNDIQIVFSKRDLGNNALPAIGVIGNRIDVTLNSNTIRATSTADLIEAFDILESARSLIRIEVVAGDQFANIASEPTLVYSPITTSGANDIVVQPAYIGVPDTASNHIVVRFGETLPDDLYQIDIFGDGANSLQNSDGFRVGDLTNDGINNGADQSIGFELDLAPQVISVVPQPVIRQDDGTLQQNRKQIVVYFTEDELSRASAENTSFYQLIYLNHASDLNGNDDIPDSIHPTATNLDDEVIFPESAIYNAELNAVLLTFENDIDNSDRKSGTYRLRVGTSEYRPLAPTVVDLSDDPGSTFTGVDENGDATVEELSEQWGTDLTLWDTGSTVVVLTGGDKFDDGQIFTIVAADGSGEYQFEFDKSGDGVATGNVAVVVNAADTPDQIATTIATAINDPINAISGVTARALPGSSAETTIEISGDAGIVLASEIRGLSLATRGVIIQQSIRPSDNAGERLLLDFPGGKDEPGHRDIPIDDAMHILDVDNFSGIETIEYNFRSVIGLIPGTAGGVQPSYNAITEEQKTRAREVFELISNYAGVQFVETAEDGLIVATGDMRTLGCSDSVVRGGCDNALAIPESQGTRGLFGEGDNRVWIEDIRQEIVLMDKAEDWNDERYEDWFQIAFHEIGHSLGLEHAYDLAAIMGQENTPDGARYITPIKDIEEQYPGNQDIVHLQRLMRPESIDIDMYEFSVAQKGIFTAETMAERLLDLVDEKQLLDTSMNLYQVRVQTDVNSGLPVRDPNGQLIPLLDSNDEEIKDLIAYNDDYFSRDSYIDVELRPGKYYIGVSASGNTSYDPMVENSGIGGLTQGQYELRLNYRPFDTNGIIDVDNPVEIAKP
ncbi:MAG: matrixin family metalloprotease, partial [Planctomycetaceae bacterium]|nr:matrixin family metalloprotease [Planctomycetaceae bacterium]